MNGWLVGWLVGWLWNHLFELQIDWLIDCIYTGKHNQKELFLLYLIYPVAVFQISIFMTHSPNYVKDRLALYTFESLIKFISSWTNLKLKSLQPLELGKMYFDMYPDEKEPIWSVSIK